MKRRAFLGMAAALLVPWPAAADSRYERQRLRYKWRNTPSRFKFPGKGGEWEISYPPTWLQQPDPRQADTYIFISRDDRVRLLLTRRVLNPEIQGQPLELEERNLEVAQQLAKKMAESAAGPPRVKEWHNRTCRGLYFQLQAKNPRPGDYPHVVGVCAVKDRFHLVGYFQMKDRGVDLQTIIINMIESISFGPPTS